MQQKAVSLFLCYLLLYTCGGVEAGTRKNSKKSKDSGSGFWSTLTYMAVGGGLLAAGLPALGFTGAGIAANSVAASLMSWSAVANGGGVPAGGLVATLQSLGASGGSTLMAKVGAFLGYAVHNQMQNNGADEEEE
ncbi:interferon alpha inducible protein 6 [Rhinolophus ferrumequinum]|uniref:Interferon alpha inducible protein 6 n=1 Tax=Rhinolophus ferrumequinum TaxID=59479 RepID=A0A671EBK6_RHIFE|nr:interferon alpha-inducible protein 6 [Rhinolophus ferrumequinum]XP_032969151.1 interferon alpha-inducible protein 6 [Rhinolophus ferrumequinum]KAF6344701.1 interferon alpha inducible protein 6 [Rhinolophus ferrumequinum]